MLNDILSIGFAVDTKDLVRGSRELDNFGKSANKASGQADTATKAVGGMGKSVTALVAAIGSATLVRVLLQATEQFTKLNAQLKISARTQEDYAKSFQDVVRISNLAQSSLEGTATLYARLANTLKDTNVTQQQFANITESVALGLRVSGASAGEAQSAMLQLSQAFASGVLRGEEFNAVSEASFPLMKALADSMGIPIEQLRTMAMNGKITRDELVKAFSDPALIASFQAQAKELNTVGGAFQVLKNNITIAIGEFDQATGASAALAKAIVLLGQNLDVLLVVLAPVGIALAALAAPAVLAGLAALVAVFASPIGIIALLTAAGGAVLKFGIESETAYSKALKGAQKFNDEQRKTADVTKTTVSAGVKEFEKLGKAKDEASARATELQKRISSLLNRADMKGRVSELRAELEDVQLALKNINAESDKLFVTLSKQGDVLGAKVPFMRAILPEFTGAPNFTANLEARNVDEINAKLEERAKLEKERIQAVKDADKKEFERAQARFNQAKEFNDMETKFFNLLEKSADDRDKKSLSFKNQMHEMDKKFLDVLDRTESKIIDEAQKKKLDALKELEQEQKRISDNLNRSLTDALLRGFESGLSFAENFKRSLINMFKTVVLQPIISAVLKPVTDTVGSIVSGITGTGATGGTTDIAGTLGGIGNLFQNASTSIVSGVASFGQALTNFGATGSSFLTNTASSLGSFVQLNQAFIAKALPFLDAGIKLLSGDVKGAAFSAGGAALGGYLGSLGSIGGPVGAVIGTVVGNLLGNVFGGKEQPPRTTTQLPDVAEAFNQQLSALIKGFGGAGNVTSTASFKGRAGGSGYGGFNAMFDGMAIDGGLKYQDSYSEKTLQEFITRILTTTLTKAIESTNIDQAFKNLFAGITDRDEMGKTIQAVLALNNNNKQLTNTLGVTAVQVALLAKESGIAGDSLISFVNTLNGISNELFTTGDALVSIKAGIDGAFLTLSNTQVPANLKAFDEAIKAIDKTTAEGRQDFLGLVALRGTFAEFENAMAGLRGNVRGALFGIVSEAERQAMLEADLAKLFKDLNREVPATVQELIALGQSIDYTTAEGINLASVFPTLVSAFNTTRGAVVGLMNDLTDTSAAARAQADLVRSVFPLLDVTEQLTILNADLFEAFDAVNIQLPASVDELIELARTIDTTTDAGLSLGKAFPELVRKFVEFENATKAQTQALEDAAKAQTQALEDAAKAQMQIIADSANEANRLAQESLQEATRNADNARDILMNSFDAERTRMQGIIDNVGSLRENLATVIAAEKDRLQLIINNVDTFKNALRQAFDVKINGLQNVVDAVGNFKQQLSDVIDIERNRLQGIIANVDNLKNALFNVINVERDRFQAIINNVDTFKNALVEAFDAERSRLEDIVIAVGDVRQELQNVIDVERSRYQAIINNVDNFKDALRQAFDTKASGLQDTISKFKDFGKTIRDFRKGLLQTSTVVSNPLDFNRAKFLETASLAKAGDLTAMDELTSVARDFLESSENYSRDFNQYQSDFLEVNRILGDVENSTFASASVAELQLDLLKQQVGALINLDENILSVEDAIANLLDAQSQANVAQLKIERLNEIQAQYLGSSNDSLISVDATVSKLVEAQNQANIAQARIEQLNQLQAQHLGTSNDTLVSVDEAINNLIQAQAQANVAQVEIQRLNEIQAQYLGLNNDELISVNDAIENLLNAQNEANVAQSEITRLNQIQAQYLGTSNQSLMSVDTAVANLVTAQNKANIAQAEIERLNVLQTELLGSNNQSLVSVDVAIQNLTQAQNAATQAGIEIERLNAIQTQYLGSSSESLMSLDLAIENLLNAQTLASEEQFGLNNLNRIQNEILGTINNSVLDVSTAISRFNVAVQAQVNAQSKANTAKEQVDKIQSMGGIALTPENIYTTFLGREADAEGLAFWQKQFGATVDLNELRTFQKSVIENLELGRGVTKEAINFSTMKFANGGAFTNGVVSTPTMFNTGLMGESGSEAIMPLSNVGGRLGVTTNNSEMVAQLKVISEKITRLEAVQVATAQNTGKVAKIIERADNGESINVTVTA